MYALKSPPDELRGVLSQDLFVKAQAYGLDKCRYSLLKTLFDQAIAFAMIRGHVYSRAWDSTGRLMDAAGLGQEYTVRR
jgi:STE24 endopeptidase